MIGDGSTRKNQLSAGVSARADDAPDASFPDPRHILESIGQTVYDWDIATDRIAWGPNALAALGLGDPVLIGTGRAYADLTAPGSRISRYRAIVSASADGPAEGGPYSARYGLQPSGAQGRGPVIWVEDTGRWFAGADGRPARAHGVVRVITAHYEAEREMEYRSQFDPLTGCLNRAHLIELVGDMLQRQAKTRQPFSILLGGVENLFAINRTYGYDVADEALAAVARRLRAGLRTSDHIARYAGNKFAIVLDNCTPEQLAWAAQRFAAETASASYETSAGQIPLAMRFGGVTAPRDGRNENALFQNAEEALDQARDATATRFVAYEQSLERKDSRLNAARIADEVVSALNEGRVMIALQPIVAASNGAPAFHEALLRLRAADGSVQMPGAILPVAEKAGLIRLLDQRVLELALARLAADPALVLSVNVSTATLHDPEWPIRLKAMLTQNAGLAQRLIIEITESSAIVNPEKTQATIQEIRSLGARVAMDDFGAGHTSFRNLRRLSFDLIKMDGAFVQNVARSADDRFFVRTLIDLARHMNIPMVAEWVEDADTAALLRGWNVAYMQGNFFGAAKLPEPLAQADAPGKTASPKDAA
ncbi:MAG: GGDEF domain-containing protein [Hyphomicrobiales bacterium]|nr:GGDEF domain-containing protein [Hyphomicrobiales bacterium]